MKPQNLNHWHLAAALLMALTVLIHVFAGGPEVMTPIRASALDPVVIAVSNVIWHAITLILTLTGVALFWLVRHQSTPLVAFVVTLQLGFAALFLGCGLADLGTIWPMPQWVIFLGIPALILLGERGRA